MFHALLQTVHADRRINGEKQAHAEHTRNRQTADESSLPVKFY